MITKNWVKKHRAFVGKVMIKVNFKLFLEEKKLTIEELAFIIKYTIPGTERMLERETIKPAIYNILKNKFKNFDKYVIDKKGAYKYGIK